MKTARGWARARGLMAATVLVLSATPAWAGNWSSMVVFGDSLSDTGSSLHYTNQIPLTTTRPTAPAYAHGRWTNGAATQYANLNLTPTGSNTIWHWAMADALGTPRAMNVHSGVPNRNNYAAGGAVTGLGQQSSGGYTTSDNIGHQVNTMFLGSNPTMSNATLYAIMGGGNDIRDAVRSGTASTADTARAAGRAAAANIGTYINALASRAQTQNVRITVAWPNVVPMQLIPDFADAYGGNLTWRQLSSLSSVAFRDEWTAQINTLRAAFPNNLDLHGVNLWQYFTDMAAGQVPGTGGLNMTDPVLNFNGFTDFSFSPTRNPALPAGANPDSYVFWDQVHPTARVHQLMGAFAASQVPAPSSALVVLGLLGVGARRRRAGVAALGV